MVQQTKKLDPLPDSQSDFWEHADVNIITPHGVLSEHGHYFERKPNRSAQCKLCDWGFILDPGDEIRDGHLYNGGKLII